MLRSDCIFCCVLWCQAATTLSKSTLAKYTADKTTLPEDLHYDADKLFRLFIKPKIRVSNLFRPSFDQVLFLVIRRLKRLRRRDRKVCSSGYCDIYRMINIYMYRIVNINMCMGSVSGTRPVKCQSRPRVFWVCLPSNQN